MSLVALSAACASPATVSGPSDAPATPSRHRSQLLRNPIVDVVDGWEAADPSIVFRDGYYHWVRSLRTPGIGIAKAHRLQDLRDAPLVVIYRPKSGAEDSQHLWAPELLHIRGRWLIYYAADDGLNQNHRMFALSADGQDPQGAWTARGKVATPDDHWAIDGTVLERSNGALFFLWSGWESGRDDRKQHLYIAPMSDPFTVSGGRVRISSPEWPWESSMLGTAVMRINEAPQPLEHDGVLSVVFSAAGSWSADYALGLLTHTGGDVLDPASWVKRPLPVFVANPTGRVWGVGHPTFTTSPDGRESWFVYHGMTDPSAGWHGRSLRAQPFVWNADGTPDLGVADADGAVRPAPLAMSDLRSKHLEPDTGRRCGAAAMQVVESQRCRMLRAKGPVRDRKMPRASAAR